MLCRGCCMVRGRKEKYHFSHISLSCWKEDFEGCSASNRRNCNVEIRDSGDEAADQWIWGYRLCHREARLSPSLNRTEDIYQTQRTHLRIRDLPGRRGAFCSIQFSLSHLMLNDNTFEDCFDRGKAGREALKTFHATTISIVGVRLYFFYSDCSIHGVRADPWLKITYSMGNKINPR